MASEPMPRLFRRAGSGLLSSPIRTFPSRIESALLTISLRCLTSAIFAIFEIDELHRSHFSLAEPYPFYANVTWKERLRTHEGHSTSAVSSRLSTGPMASEVAVTTDERMVQRRGNVHQDHHVKEKRQIEMRVLQHRVQRPGTSCCVARLPPPSVRCFSSLSSAAAISTSEPEAPPGIDASGATEGSETRP